MEQIKRNAISETAGILAERLNILNSQNYVKQSDISTELGISETMYNKYRRGKAVPKGETLMLIAKHFGVTTDYLLGLSNTQSVKVDIQNACKVTGLSGEAIDGLEYVRKYYPMYLPAMNSIISSDYFINILSAIEAVKNCSKYPHDIQSDFVSKRSSELGTVYSHIKDNPIAKDTAIVMTDIGLSPMALAEANLNKYITFAIEEIKKGDNNG